MTFLLDVSVLIALIDPMHIHHSLVDEWFAVEGQNNWATCPMTENGAIRIVGSNWYTNSPGTPAAVAQILFELRSLPGHTFWPDNISLLDYSKIDLMRILTPAQVTDSYLLGLAYSRGGKLATLDRRLITDAVHRGAESLHLIQ
jgi:toxin-antitoxin system PIN domain toxin